MRNIFLQTPAQSNFEQRNWMTRRVEVLLGLFAEKGVVSKWMISSHIKLIKYSSHPARETFCQFTETETILRFQPPPASATLTLNACCFRKNQDSEFSFRENWWDESAQCRDEDIGHRAPDTQQQTYFWVERAKRKNIWSAGAAGTRRHVTRCGWRLSQCLPRVRGR